MSTIKANTLLHSDGSTTNPPSIPALDQRMAKAWANFDGTTGIVVRNSFNVSSITDQAVGKYTVNFNTALPNVNYVVSMSSEDGGGFNDPRVCNRDSSQARTTSAFGIYHWHVGSSALDDATHVNLIVFAS